MKILSELWLCVGIMCAISSLVFPVPKILYDVKWHVLYKMVLMENGVVDIVSEYL